jgi:Ice-binding-like
MLLITIHRSPTRPPPSGPTARPTRRRAAPEHGQDKGSTMNRSYQRPTRRAVAVSSAILLLSAFAAPAAHAAATTPALGTAANFAAVAHTTITNTGPTIVTGDLGVFPGTAIVGFPPGTINGTIHAGDAVAGTAAADALTAYNFAAGEPCDQTLSDPDLGGKTLSPGVYCFTSTTVGLTGTLTLDAGGNPNAAWLFKTGAR